MATLQTFSNSAFTGYVNGVVRTDQYPGVSYYSTADGNRVMRGTISSSSTPRKATSVRATFYNVYSGSGNIVCHISSSSTDYKNVHTLQSPDIGRANVTVSGTGYKTVTFTFTNPIVLAPDTTYYLWFYPNGTNQGCALKIASYWSSTGATLYGDEGYTVNGTSVSGYNCTVSPETTYCFESTTITFTATPSIPSHAHVTSYTWRKWNGSSWQNISGATSSTYTVIVTTSESYSCYVTYQLDSYYISVKGYLDNSLSESIANYGTFDMYINGSLLSQGITSYYSQHTYGTTYEISNITALSGHQYLGVHSGSVSGTVTGAINVRLSFGTCPVITRGLLRIEDSTGYYAYVYVTDPGGTGIDYVEFTTWTTSSGQDDIVSTRGEQGTWTIDGNTYNWRCKVNKSDHNNEYGTYNTKAVAYAVSGAYGSWLGSIIVSSGLIRLFTSSEFKSCYIYIFTNNSWRRTIPYARNSSQWKQGQ